MPTMTAGRQTAADMFRDLLPGNVRVGVGIYDHGRGRTYRAVTDGEMVTYVRDVSPAQLKRLWKSIDQAIKNEELWR